MTVVSASSMDAHAVMSRVDGSLVETKFDLNAIPTPTTSSQVNSGHDHYQVKSPGDVWLWPRKENGKDWPVMLCSDDILPRDQESIEDNSLIPAFLLGRRKWIWVRDDERLKPWDASHDYLHGLARFENEDVVDGDDKAANIEKQWRRAYLQDAMQFWGPEQWVNYMENESAIRELEIEMDNKAKVKRGRVSESGRRPGHAHDGSSGSQSKRRKLNGRLESYRALAVESMTTPKRTASTWSESLRCPVDNLQKFGPETRSSLRSRWPCFRAGPERKVRAGAMLRGFRSSNAS
ncbi:hypothetical protein EJ03DRAFT_198030 [Teratosphaeria nubilosa]|uniref:PWWP domain-containing protein n=1 Tax=Teratosphaeria nubilosa TaxID=161662 RepID=A0A6G1KYH2_9PEZI|nr:hypothetical protein EJ03DRAFT_198030 [Teratosphaeria nubilosa]